MPMIPVRFFPEPLLLAEKGCVVAVGNFDGVHAGHRALLAIAATRAQALDVPLVALTFEPHPRSVLFPHVPLHRLTELEDKATLLAQAGVAGVAVFPFTVDMAAWSPERFIEEALQGWLHAQTVVVGENFNFGAKAAGNAETLKEAKMFEVLVAPLLRDNTGEVISSRRIRAALGA